MMTKELKRVIGWVGNSQYVVDYRATFDEDRLKRLALKAAGNKNGKAVDGPITVFVESKKQIG